MKLFDVTTLEAALIADLPETESFLTSDMTIYEARSLWLRQSLLKKYVPSGAGNSAREALLQERTLALFLEMNDHCSHAFEESSFDTQELLALNIMREKIFNITHDRDQVARFSLERSFALGKTGPGAAVGVSTTSHYEKLYAGTLAHSHSGLLLHYHRMLHGEALTAEIVRQLCLGTETVVGSSSAFAPKTSEIKRFISPQPPLDMYYQLGSGAQIEEWLRTGLNIDLSTQPDINRAMALQGSIDGENCTIDLRSASDCISNRFMRRQCPADFLAFLDLQRPRAVVLPSGEVVQLEMYSMMGNGFTFPLQTMLFALLVESCYEVLGITIQRRGAHRNYSVFGDDIIVSRKAYHFVCRVLERCGFLVNETKSFGSGSFRESCGHDYFRGFNIRGVYLRKVDCDSHIYSLINRLLRWCCESGVMLPETLAYLRGLVKHRPVPYHVSDTGGIKTPFCYVLGRKIDRNGSTYYRAYEPIIFRVDRLDGPNFTGLYNPAGLLMACLGGYIRSGREVIRKGDTCFKLGKPKVSPHWEYGLPTGVATREYEVVYQALILRDPSCAAL